MRDFHKSATLTNKNAVKFCLKFVIAFRITPNFAINLSKLFLNYPQPLIEDHSI